MSILFVSDCDCNCPVGWICTASVFVAWIVCFTSNWSIPVITNLLHLCLLNYVSFSADDFISSVRIFWFLLWVASLCYLCSRSFEARPILLYNHNPIQSTPIDYGSVFVWWFYQWCSLSCMLIFAKTRLCTTFSIVPFEILRSFLLVFGFCSSC